MHDKVARLRQLMTEAIPAQPAVVTHEAEAARAFRLYEFNTAPALVLDQTPRARAERAIERIAAWYGWHGEIARALDRTGASSLSGMDEESLHALQQRMLQLEDCVREGLDCPDAPPAR